MRENFSSVVWVNLKPQEIIIPGFYSHLRMVMRSHRFHIFSAAETHCSHWGGISEKRSCRYLKTWSIYSFSNQERSKTSGKTPTGTIMAIPNAPLKCLIITKQTRRGIAKANPRYHNPDLTNASNISSQRQPSHATVSCTVNRLKNDPRCSQNSCGERGIGAAWWSARQPCACSVISKADTLQELAASAPPAPSATTSGYLSSPFSPPSTAPSDFPGRKAPAGLANRGDRLLSSGRRRQINPRF